MKAQINVHGEVYAHCLYGVRIVDRAKHVRFTSRIQYITFAEFVLVAEQKANILFINKEHDFV
jgi:hypothetical protein